MTSAHIRDLDDPAFDPFAGDSIAHGDTLDPHSRVAKLRRQSSVHASSFRSFFDLAPNQALAGERSYSVFSYDAITEMLTRAEEFTSEAMKRTLGLAFGRSLSTMDSPEHPRYRKIFQKAFMPQVVAKWGDAIVDPVIAQLMGGFEERGQADLVGEFTLHYPFQIIYRQLALPAEDVTTFHKLAVTQTAYAYALDKAVEAGVKLGEYFGPMVLDRRADPGDDLISLLATAQVDGELLPLEIVVSFLRQLINAGGDTTYRATSNLLVALLSHPEQLIAVQADRSLVPAAIDEALRWEGPVGYTRRWAMNDLEIAGHRIESGSVVDVVVSAANRDEAYFPDPDRFDIFRSKSAYRHVAFATGPHVCIGQHLARVEMTRALNTILDRLPNLRLDPDMPAPEIRGYHLRAPEHIHVRFG